MNTESEAVLEIKQLYAGEWERLRQIRLAALKEAPEAFGSTFEAISTVDKEGWTKQLHTLPTFVATHHGIDSGIVRCAPCSDRKGVADLISMWVAPEARGKGVGEALIEAVISWCRSEGYTQLLLEVGDRNTFAMALYERKGFKATGRTSRFPSPRQHIEEHEMSLTL